MKDYIKSIRVSLAFPFMLLAIVLFVLADFIKGKE